MRRAKQDMPFALAAKCIDQHAENFGYYVDLFAWGEPLMYRDLCDVIRYAVAAGTPMVHLNTNGGLMTPGMARDLVDSGIHGVNISALPSAGMAWELAARNLRAARDAAHSETPFIQIQATERPEITLPCAQAAGADALLSRKMLDLGRGAGIPDSGARPQCAQLWRNLVILADGSVTPCCGDAECVLRVGDMAHATLREIWNGTAMSDLRRAELEGKPVSLCVRCPDRDRR
jgi:MoaA/NifB/PqqE/SkfB family radical SAM enzyme